MFMECIYYKELQEIFAPFTPPMEESKHLKALRLSESEHILVTNGKGLSAECRVELIAKNQYKLTPVSFSLNSGEASLRYSLAIGRLSNRDRLEFAIEKAIELGVYAIYIIDADHSERLKLGDERLEAKAIAAIKQCKRSNLPIIHNNIKLNQLLNLRDNINFILLDEDGTHPENAEIAANVEHIILVGPEGGFSDKELSAIKAANPTVWKLGNRRLRAETAAICGISYFVNK
jgi:16S rRNA (uracil1498-N3)-methyltransferase